MPSQDGFDVPVRSCLNIKQMNYLLNVWRKRKLCPWTEFVSHRTLSGEEGCVKVRRWKMSAHTGPCSHFGPTAGAGRGTEGVARLSSPSLCSSRSGRLHSYQCTHTVKEQQYSQWTLIILNPRQYNSLFCEWLRKAGCDWILMMQSQEVLTPPAGWNLMSILTKYMFINNSAVRILKLLLCMFTQSVWRYEMRKVKWI